MTVTNTPSPENEQPKAVTEGMAKAANYAKGLAGDNAQAKGAIDTALGFFTFQNIVTPKIMAVLYLVLAVLYTFETMRMARHLGVFGFTKMFIFGHISLRIACETTLAIFRIAANTSSGRRQG